MEAIIFDMDGVIIDSEPIHYICSNKYLSPYNIELNREIYDTYIGGSCKVMWNDVREKHGLEDSVDTIISKEFELYSEYLRNGKGTLQPIEGVRELLAELQEAGERIALASSSALDNINAVLDVFDLQEYFELKVTGMDFAETKPHPEIFEQTAKRLGVDPSKCIVIEDSSNGVASAKGAGMICIGYQNPNCGYQDLSKADLVVDSITEINLDLLKSLTR